MSLRPLVLAGSFARTAAGLSLHPASGEAASICTGLRGVALRVTLLAAETVLGVLLCALVEGLAVSTTTAFVLGVLGGGGDIEEVLLIRSCDIGTLSLCMFVSIPLFVFPNGGGTYSS
jgi:hypothetical protein